MSDNMNMDDREKLLRQDGMLIGIAVVCLLNGMYFSPWINLVAAALAPLLAAFFVSSPVLLFYFASLTLSVMTVILSGIPAALYERSQGQTQSSGMSLGIWLGCALLLSIPAIMGLFN